MEYPTLVFNYPFVPDLPLAVLEELIKYPKKKGLVAIAEDITINIPFFPVSLNFEPNCETIILGNNRIDVINDDYCKSISLGSRSVLKGENNNLIKLMAVILIYTELWLKMLQFKMISAVQFSWKIPQNLIM